MSLESGLICILKCDEGYKHLIIKMHCIESPNKKGIRFDIKGKNIKSGYHALHIHERGNILKGCESLGPHYNPINGNHSDINDIRGHYGDLGNILFNEKGECDTILISNVLSLENIIGRSIVLHENKDDLGKGGNMESLKTGNSGARICCGVIGYI
jgi:Cu-Zn family superoxide dismutase